MQRPCCRAGSLPCLPPQKQALLGKPFLGRRAPLLTARKHVSPAQLSWPMGRPACKAAQQQGQVCARLVNASAAGPPRLMSLLCVQNPFSSERELQGVQKTLAGMSSTVFYGAVTLLVAAAAAAGYGAGGRAPGQPLHA